MNADMQGRSTTNASSAAGRIVRQAALRVPQITVFFWIIKAMSTALGESTSDYLVHAISPVVAVCIGFVGFVIALCVQFSMRRYVAWAYWFAVVMVGIFGTMAADVLHVAFHVPYVASAVFYGIALAAVFITWQRFEHTLSMHSIDTPRRELFYWAAVVTTFALGTAVGDLAALTLHLGYLGSAALFASLILIPAIGYGWFDLEPDPRVLVRVRAHPPARRVASPTGWASRPSAGGLGWGSGWVSLSLAAMIFVFVAFLAAHRRRTFRTNRRDGAGAAGRRDRARRGRARPRVRAPSG